MGTELERENGELFPHKNNCQKTFCNECNDKNLLSSQADVSLSSQQKLELSSWGLPEKVLQFYHSKGITHMFQWQLECLSLGNVLDSGNLVYSAPTSAGKTLVAEILISKSIFELQKKALMILPFVSVVREKMFYFQGMYSSSGINVEGYMGGHTPSICFKQVHLAVCTIEKANSIINRLLEEQTLQNLGLVVVDELHLLGDPYRGYLLELLLTKLKYISSKSGFKIQIVGMSATLPNLKSLADWLSADLYYTDFRPVPLNEKLKCGTTILDKKLNKISELTPLPIEASDDSENVGQLCVETIANGHSVLIFCPTKVWCENLAEKISLFFRKNGCSKSAETEGTPGWILRNQLNLENINEVIQHLKMSPVGLDKALHKTIAYGVAFHHAGLTLDERDIIEGSFRKGFIRVLCATSTLSSGVNLPARRVIIRSPMSFGGLMDILTYRQMIGRAGRMGVDKEGESILICKPNETAACQSLMCASLKPIESCLGHGRLSASLKRALLEIVASGIASNPEEVKKYASCTYLAFSSKHDIEDPIQSCIEFLEENEFIRLQENGTVYMPTPLAKACLASSLPPDEGLALFRELQRARRCFVLDTDLHIIYQVTPYSVSEQWSKVDWLNVLNILEGLPASMKRVGELVGVEEAFLVRVVKGAVNPNATEYRNKLSIHRRFYTSLALQDLVNEMPLSEVAEKYECNKGMLQSLQQSAATYAGMVTEFTKCLGWNSIELIFSQFQERLQFGIQRELCELMRLPLLNAMRARALFNAGFKSLSAIANANVTDLENVFFGMAPFQSKKEIAGETKYDNEQRNRLEAIWITGKADLSVREAAELILLESRNILELELGLEGIQWGKKTMDTSVWVGTQNKTMNCSTEGGVSINKTQTACEPSLPAGQRGNAAEISHDKFNENQPLAVIESSNSNYENNCDKNEAHNVDNQILYDSDVIAKQPQVTESWNRDKPGVEEAGESTGKESVDTESLPSRIPESEELSNSKGDEGRVIVMENVLHSGAEPSQVQNRKDVTDYFASSFNFDIIPDYEVEEKAKAKEIDHEVKDSSDIDAVFHESDTNSSVEILYDSTVHNGTKNLSFSRLSDDMFEISKRGKDNIKNMSTPIASHTVKIDGDARQDQLAETRSPDLFSQSLTFDTQMRRILDFDERPHEDNPQIINPSSSVNSDDLGFVSDLSPAKPNGRESKLQEQALRGADKQAQLRTAGIGSSFIGNGFASPVEEKIEGRAVATAKRKVAAVDSPDLIEDSDESLVENQHVPKRIKYSLSDDKSVVLSPNSAADGNESDDEIMPTPKVDNSRSSSASNKSRVGNSSVANINQIVLRDTSQRSKVFLKSLRATGGKSLCPNGLSNTSRRETIEAKVPRISCKTETVKWDKINAIDVCEGEKEFRFFCEQLKEQNIVGLALGCRRRSKERKSVIGMKITKRRKVDDAKEKSSDCQYRDLVLEGIAFYWHGNDVSYMTLDDGIVPLAEKIILLRRLCMKEKTFRVFDAKEQIKMVQNCCSVLLACSYQDPKIAHWLLTENWKDKSFPTMTLEYLPTSKTLVSLMGSVVGYSSPGLLGRSNTPSKTRACLEAFLTYHVVGKQLPLLQEKGVEKAFNETEMPIAICLAEMELAGFRICRDTLSKIEEKIESARETLEEKAFSIAQHKFSISSSAAVSKVLYKQLGLEGNSVVLTKKRKLPSTSKQALRELANETNHPLPEIILNWRKIRSISTKFVSPLQQISCNSTRVHGVSQTFTVTGRISMHEPNLQNIPKHFILDSGRDEPTSINMREAFVATENCVLVSVDYCQIELRMLAHLSRDGDLIKDIKGASDIFVSIAATVFGVPDYEVDSNLRQRAKQTCYGMIYGIGPRNLAQQLEMEESDAEELIEDFKNKYPGVKNYLEQTVSECRRRGYVSTLLNRRRYLPAINDTNQATRMEAERQAVNTTIQGSAADLVKTAMITWREKSKDFLPDEATAHLVLHLHDELIFEVGNESVESVAVLLKDAMESAVDLLVPTPVKIKVGPSWGQLEDYDF